jgi:A/G-specific adenine glycosylase
VGELKPPTLDRLTGALLAWGESRLRDLPWRRTRDAWIIFVSEVMLQQTSVTRVLPKFDAFIARFPQPGDLARAPLGEALVLWEGLGCPRRCRNLRDAASVIQRDHGGRVPDNLNDLLALPGVGPYTARAILAFAFAHDVAVVDTNVARVLSRVAGEPMKLASTQTLADELVPRGRAWEWNQIMMDFGATVCTARNPKCDQCVLADICEWAGDIAQPDPATTTQGTSRPQAKFEGSDRQARGRALRAVSVQPLTDIEVFAAMGLSHDVERARRLLDQLLTEGLVARVDGDISLP